MTELLRAQHLAESVNQRSASVLSLNDEACDALRQQELRFILERGRIFTTGVMMRVMRDVGFSSKLPTFGIASILSQNCG